MSVTIDTPPALGIRAEPGGGYRLVVDGIPIGPSLATARAAQTVLLWLSVAAPEYQAALRRSRVERWLGIAVDPAIGCEKKPPPGPHQGPPTAAASESC